MTTELLEQRLHDLAVAAPDPARISARVLGTPASRRRGALPRIAASAVAVVVLAALVAYLAPVTTTVIADVPFAGDLLRDAGLIGAQNRITSVGSSATSSGYTITLVGAYADSTRTVLLVRSNPVSLPAGFNIRLTDQFLRSYPYHGGSTDMRNGNETMEFDPLGWPDAKTGARITLHLEQVTAVGPNYTPGATVNGSWDLAATIGVYEAASLAIPAPASLGKAHFRFTSVSYTPATIEVDMDVSGVSFEDLNRTVPDVGRSKGMPAFMVELVDPSGEISPGGGSGTMFDKDAFGVIHTRTLIYRTGGAGDYTLRVSLAGAGSFDRVLSIP